MQPSDIEILVEVVNIYDTSKKIEKSEEDVSYDDLIETITCGDLWLTDITDPTVLKSDIEIHPARGYVSQVVLTCEKLNDENFRNRVIKDVRAAWEKKYGSGYEPPDPPEIDECDDDVNLREFPLNYK